MPTLGLAVSIAADAPIKGSADDGASFKVLSASWDWTAAVEEVEGDCVAATATLVVTAASGNVVVAEAVFCDR